MRILVSVRNSDEAAIAASAGVDFIDLKEPASGALGGLSTDQIRAIVASLAGRGPGMQVSATIGDLPVEAETEILARVGAVATCGVDLVKVGLPGQGGPAALRIAERLAGLGVPLVPVLIADQGLAPDFVAAVVELPFAAIMLDTQVKTDGSLLNLLPEPTLMGFLASARRAGRTAGLAGALRLADLPALRRLDPDFAGFRSAVCEGPRASALSADCLGRLLAELRAVEVG